MKRKQAKNSCLYLEKHRHRMINYDYYQAEGICSMGSGAVESAIKQIDRRVQISGARWKMSCKFWHTALPTSMDDSHSKDDMLPLAI